MTRTATRLITLILMLQRQPGQKAADIASRLNVSVRTLHRYFGMLDEMGVPVYAERGRYGGFSLVRGYKLPPLVFTLEEAVAVSLGASLMGEMWGKLYAEAAQGALAKLENVLPDEQRQEMGWARRSLIVTGTNRADMEMLAPVLVRLRKAVRDHCRVRMTYSSQNNPRGDRRELDPYALIHRAGWWYVVGYCHLRQALRSFRVDRITELELTGQDFTAPVDFDVKAYLAQMGQDVPQVKVRMRFTAQFAHLAMLGRDYWAKMDPQPGGAVIVTFNAPDAYTAASNALAYGPAVKVLEPPEVRQLVVEWARATAEYYEDETKDEP
jgi:predicted DNA-binding transcriptional regulator YafY